MADAVKNKWNPGMRSDSEPQPTQDSDFGPGMEYESGDRNAEDAMADQIRQHWQESHKASADETQEKIDKEPAIDIDRAA